MHRQFAEPDAVEPPAQHHRLEDRKQQQGEHDTHRGGNATGNERSDPILAEAEILGNVAALRDRRKIGPVERTQSGDDPEHQRRHDQEPHREAAQEQSEARTLEASGQVAIVCVPHLVALEARLHERIDQAEGQHDQYPPERCAERVADRGTGLVEAHAAQHRAGEAIAPARDRPRTGRARTAVESRACWRPRRP